MFVSCLLKNTVEHVVYCDLVDIVRAYFDQIRITFIGCQKQKYVLMFHHIFDDFPFYLKNLVQVRKFSHTKHMQHLFMLHSRYWIQLYREIYERNGWKIASYTYIARQY